MIVEQSDNKLTIQKEKEVRTILGWLMLLLGIGVIVSSLWISLPLWVTYPFGFGILLILLIAPIMILEPKTFIFDRITGELTILYHFRILKRKIEWGKVYSLTVIKAVVLVTLTNTGDPEGDGYFVELIIQRPKSVFKPTDKHLTISYCDDNWSSKKAMAERVASILGLSIQEKTKKSFPIYVPPSGT